MFFLAVHFRSVLKKKIYTFLSPCWSCCCCSSSIGHVGLIWGETTGLTADANQMHLIRIQWYVKCPAMTPTVKGYWCACGVSVIWVWLSHRKGHAISSLRGHLMDSCQASDWLSPNMFYKSADTRYTIRSKNYCRICAVIAESRKNGFFLVLAHTFHSDRANLLNHENRKINERTLVCWKAISFGRRRRLYHSKLRSIPFLSLSFSFFLTWNVLSSTRFLSPFFSITKAHKTSTCFKDRRKYLEGKR